MAVVGSHNYINPFLRQNNRTEALSPTPAGTCTRTTISGTQVPDRERIPTDWTPGKKSEKSQIRWSDKADTLQEPTTLRPVSALFTSLCTHRDTDAEFGLDAQASCYIGGSSGIRSPKASNLSPCNFSDLKRSVDSSSTKGLKTWPRIDVRHLPEFREGSFQNYFLRIKLVLYTYPDAERLPILMTKMSDEVVYSMREILKARLDTMSLEEFVTCLSSRFRENSSNFNQKSAGDMRWQMRDIPMFNGDANENFDIWYRRAAMYLRTYAPEERLQRLCSRLGQKPFQFLQQRSRSTLENFDAVLQCLKREYGETLSASEAQELFYTKQQGANMSLQTFEGELRKLARIAHPEMSDALREEAILRRVQAGMTNGDLVRHFVFNPPTSFQEFYKAADLLQQDRNLSSQTDDACCGDKDAENHAEAHARQPVSHPLTACSTPNSPPVLLPTNMSTDLVPPHLTRQYYDCDKNGQLSKDSRLIGSHDHDSSHPLDTQHISDRNCVPHANNVSCEIASISVTEEPCLPAAVLGKRPPIHRDLQQEDISTITTEVTRRVLQALQIDRSTHRENKLENSTIRPHQSLRKQRNGLHPAVRRIQMRVRRQLFLTDAMVCRAPHTCSHDERDLTDRGNSFTRSSPRGERLRLQRFNNCARIPNFRVTTDSTNPRSPNSRRSENLHTRGG